MRYLSTYSSFVILSHQKVHLGDMLFDVSLFAFIPCVYQLPSLPTIFAISSDSEASDMVFYMGKTSSIVHFTS